MEKSTLKKNILYENENTGLALLSDLELDGDYPFWFFDQAVHLYNSHWPFPKSKDETKKFVLDLYKDKSRIVFSIYDMGILKHIGNISIQNIDLLNNSAELAFLLGDKQSWGKGHGYRAAKLALNHCFIHLNLNRVYLGCLENNMGMNRLANKLRFIKEGARRQAILKENLYIDVIEYGLLKNEYEAYLNCKS